MVDLKEMREKAARARRESIDDTSPDGIRRARAAAPLDVGRSRSLTFPVTLRASMEKRANAAADEPEWVHLSGIASVTETPYEMYDMFGPYVETVASTAFSASLSRKPDVAFLVNHTGLTMARTTNGTLVLSSSDKGLGTEAWLNPTRSDVGDLSIAINDGCIDQMSFAAMLNGGEWNDEYTEFRMTELDLNYGDVSAVNYGANPNTTIAARAHRLLNEMDRLPSGAAMTALRHLEVRFGKEPSSAAGNEGESSESTQGRSINLVRSALLADDDE